ncbi:DEAD/DEAH box helicase [Dictyobacter aurantiacus]|uniref:DEAD/DEAH box helicase n=1 Tax=Dictyobacter aurantiacus TaxID=1936993 RepID=A0A401ZGW2_9CHLR|nr:DEAD/DEAH box helicase [Dictyobacter aurantiacus]GCE06125.1 hypothetical protein KDAU_34540 [Dictyobacter aurantiacus]
MIAPIVSATAQSIALRPYQEACVERVLTRHASCPKGGKALIVLPTGCGKTVVFTEIARRLGLRTLIIAHRQELLQQAADKFRMVDSAAVIGQVGAGRHEYGAPITVASVQTISRPEHLKQVKRFGCQLIIIDECHHSTASGYQAVLDALPEAFVLGVTATPDRLDHQSIERVFGEPIFTASIIDMVEQGYLCDLRAIAIPTAASLDNVHTQAGDFKLDELEVAVDTEDRNNRIVSAYLQHCRGRQALCFSVTVEHAEHLAVAFTTAGIHAAVVSGDTPLEVRKRILHQYERGDIAVVCNCGVLSEGYDAPQTSCVILARPTKSRGLFTQCIGRGTRLAPGKSDCVVLDITDNCLRHRIQPLTLRKVLELPLLDGESVMESKKRQILEQEQEREKEERTTKVSRRTQDLVLNMLDRMAWQRRSGGSYVLEVGEQKHQIYLIPSEEKDGYYSVWAKLAPTFQQQQWLKESTLEWAQQHAEMKARLLQSSAKKLVLVDSTAPWRARPASDRQLYMLRKYKLDFDPAITSGEASDLIGKAKEDEAKNKAGKKAKKAQRVIQKLVRGA